MNLCVWGATATEWRATFKDTVGKFRFRLRAQNGEIIAESQAYDSKEGCQTGIASVKENASKAEIKDYTP